MLEGRRVLSLSPVGMRVAIATVRAGLLVGVLGGCGAFIEDRPCLDSNVSRCELHSRVPDLPPRCSLLSGTCRL